MEQMQKLFTFVTRPHYRDIRAQLFSPKKENSRKREAGKEVNNRPGTEHYAQINIETTEVFAKIRKAFFIIRQQYVWFKSRAWSRSSNFKLPIHLRSVQLCNQKWNWDVVSAENKTDPEKNQSWREICIPNVPTWRGGISKNSMNSQGSRGQNRAC